VRHVTMKMSVRIGGQTGGLAGGESSENEQASYSHHVRDPKDTTRGAATHTRQNSCRHLRHSEDQIYTKHTLIPDTSVFK